MKGKLREIAYAWGPAKLATLSEATSLARISDRFVGLHINELLDAVTKGVHETFAIAEIDPVLAASLERSAPLHFDEMKTATLEGLLAQGKETSA